MNVDTALEILKKAILLEKRGEAFYRQAAQSSEDEAVKRFFESMASEEVKHVDVLSAQYKSYRRTQRFVALPHGSDEKSDLADAVLTDDLKRKLSAAGFEAAAISAAMAMEAQAVKLYADRAAASSQPEEKALYGWLAEWEKTHLKMLTAIDRALTEAVWFDNQFWPF